MIIVEYHSQKDDKISMVFTSPKREEYALLAERLWNSVIADNYRLLPNNIIYLEPSTYWTIYKKIKNGKSFIKGIGYKMLVNGVQHTFPITDFYFHPIDIEMNGSRGVYGIYYQDKLLYIGSTNNFERRWTEHYNNFINKDKSQPMYQIDDIDTDLLDFQVLEDDTSVEYMFGIEEPSMWIYNLIEGIYIKVLKPIYNIAGQLQPFHFTASSEDLPLGYWKMIKYYLTHEDIDYMNQRIIKDLEQSFNN